MQTLMLGCQVRVSYQSIRLFRLQLRYQCPLRRFLSIPLLHFRGLQRLQPTYKQYKQSIQGLAIVQSKVMKDNKKQSKLMINLFALLQLTAMSRINQSNTQLRKIFCAYHPSEFLTNFCCDSECLMPLCPNCIVEHTQQHFLESNKPTYRNIHDAIVQTKQKCYQNIILFEQLNHQNNCIYDYLMGLRQSIHNQLFEDKEEIISQINVMFDDYEDKLYKEAVAKYKQLEVYNRQQTVNINEFISEQIQTLHDQISLLKSDNCLAALITYYSTDSQIYQNSLKELNQYIAKHKKAGKILINNDAKKLQTFFQHFCENNIVVEYICDQIVKEKQQSSLKESQASKSIFNRSNRKKENEAKENSLSKSNRLTMRKQDYYKIDTNQIASSRRLLVSQPNLYNRHQY